jgi:alpha/beta hydrolase fold
MTELPPLQNDVLLSGIRSRFVRDINGLRMHVLEAGFENRGRPLVVLLHGFPELAYSWRKVMVPLAAAGFRVVAPDQRGYGRTTGWDTEYDGDLGSFRILNAVRDALGLVSAFGYRDVALVRGARFRGFGRGLVRPGAPRRVPLGRSDERTLCRPTGTALRHGRQLVAA